jgi:hypothetical protein
MAKRKRKTHDLQNTIEKTKDRATRTFFNWGWTQVLMFRKEHSVWNGRRRYLVLCIFCDYCVPVMYYCTHYTCITFWGFTGENYNQMERMRCAPSKSLWWCPFSKIYKCVILRPFQTECSFLKISTWVHPQLQNVRVARSLVFSIVFCKSCVFLFLLAIVLSVLQFTVSDYRFAVFKLFLWKCIFCTRVYDFIIY